MLFPPDNKKERLIIPSQPSDDRQNSLGMYPVIAGVSKDFRFLFIFEHPHSASMAADGLELGFYDTKINKYIKSKNQQIIIRRSCK
ncbi:hypothetical protein SBF1_7500003 [Candidatus Desulfosporosinus infrequens]|uniref:Uncharacterized protein n=1 Tax=Candidatus Desulfosporosinus infrequens TaxID=2043169 RepID=A0A2U3LRH8_9FIRM|nr:hypothetical protein SBF1_7500003 [Candidatus Desulfosporosinus infrequens]